jgi:hypothetical protein
MFTTSVSQSDAKGMDQLSKASDRVALIIGCGRAKVWKKKPWFGPTKASDAYVSPLFRACRRYAETFHANNWFILSAKYGFLSPDTLICNYDTTFGERNASEVISAEHFKSQFESTLAEYRVIVSLAGRLYNRRLASVLLKEQTLELPLASLGLFNRMKWLKKAVSDRKE